MKFMAIRKRGKVYWVDFSFNKFRYRKRSPDNTFQGAKAYELLLQQKLARGEPLEEQKVTVRLTFQEVALQWFEVYVKNNNKQSEINNKRNILKSCLIPYFGKKYIEQINNYDIEKYKNFLLQDRKLSPKTINNQLSVLSRCLKSAVEWDLLKYLPNIKLLKVPPQKYDYLTESESKLLLQNANGVWQDMILLVLQTGLRFGELIALRWQDIDLEKKVLTVNRNIVKGVEGSPKSNKARTVPLTSSILYMLKEKKKDCEFIFHDTDKNPLKYGNCMHHLHRACKKAGLRIIGWHVLRHSFASQLVSKNNSIVAIKELLGHSDIKTTMRYSHVNLPVLQNAIDSLESVFNENVTITSQLTTLAQNRGNNLIANLQKH
jgi:integrase